MRQGESLRRSNQAERQEEETNRRSFQDRATERERQPRDGGSRREEQPQNLESDANVARMPPRQQREQCNSSARRSRKRRSSSNSHGQRRRSHHSHSQKSEFAFGASNSNRHRGEPMAADQEGNLVEQYRAILDGDNVDVEERNKAQNVFVAAAGNLTMAAQLYWDDYFATQAAAANALPKPPPPQHGNNNAMRQDSSTSDDDEDFSREGSRQHPHRKIRRSLDGAFRAANRDDASTNNENNDNNNSSNNSGVQGEIAARNAASNDGDDDDEMLEERPDNNNNNNNNDNSMAGSVSVSDDEVSGSRVTDRYGGNRRNAHRGSRGTRDMERRIREAAAAVAKRVSPKDKSPPQRRRRLNNPADSKPQFLIPDSDWLQDFKQDGASIQDPLLILWGSGTPGKVAENDEDGHGVQEDEMMQPAENNMENDGADPLPAEGNVVVADEEMDDEQQEQPRQEPNASQQADAKISLNGIPHTWLNASFSLSDCGMGIALKAPKPEDIEFFTWRQQQNQERRQSGVLPPPYHCKSMTAIFSILQAMLLTGASIQGNKVNCTKAQTPWNELSRKQREMEFDSRLKDALAALIFIAAEASLQRKKQAVAKAEEEARDQGEEEGAAIIVDEAKESQNKKKIQYMKRRLRLITTCTWEDDPTAGMPQAPDGPSHRNVQVATSLTNIQDIYLYVSSNLLDFKAPGGVALFMETIGRIHGAGVLEHMMNASTTEAVSQSIHTTTSLVACTCEQRQRKQFAENPIPNLPRIDPKMLVDTTPPGHECSSHQLVSLLLTGTIESSWRGWSTGGLGFGILSTNYGQMSVQLTRPEHAVWVLQGETGYTVLQITDCKGTDRKTVSQLDTPGAVLQFSHWNSWYGQRRQSGLQLIIAGAKWHPSGANIEKHDPTHPGGASGPSRTLGLLQKRRNLERSVSLKAKQQGSSLEGSESDINISPEAVKAAKVHPDDERHYPGNHKMWRFNMGTTGKGNDEDRKLPGNIWIPYYRLTARQKRIADLKLGPKIRGILWTRWPNATIDGFTPKGEAPPIV